MSQKALKNRPVAPQAGSLGPSGLEPCDVILKVLASRAVIKTLAMGALHELIQDLNRHSSG